MFEVIIFSAISLVVGFIMGWLFSGNCHCISIGNKLDDAMGEKGLDLSGKPDKDSGSIPGSSTKLPTCFGDFEATSYQCQVDCPVADKCLREWEDDTI